MKKLALIQQECGLGDILFCQGIGAALHNSGYKVIWPIVKELIDTVKYLKTDAIFYSNTEEYPLKDVFYKLYNTKKIIQTDNNVLFLPLGFSSHVVFPFNRQVMQAKYKICKLDYNQWKIYFNFNRNIQKENELYYDVLKLKDNEEFILLNQTYATQPGTIKKDLTSFLHIFGTGKIVEMKILDGFTIFDWCKVFENMKAIITVDTSLMYILEKLNLKNKNNFFCVTRSPTTEDDIKDLFTLPWKYTHA